MQRPITILIAGLALAAVTCWFGYRLGLGPSATTLQGSDSASKSSPELVWLKQQYALSDSDYARIVSLHEAYLPTCRENCRQMALAEERVRTLLAAHPQITPEAEQAINEAARLKAVCQTAMLRHFYTVSQAMPAEQGKRYLEWVTDQTIGPTGATPLMSHGHSRH